MGVQVCYNDRLDSGAEDYIFSVCFCGSGFSLVCSNESSVRDNVKKEVEGRRESSFV